MSEQSPTSVSETPNGSREPEQVGGAEIAAVSREIIQNIFTEGIYELLARPSSSLTYAQQLCLQTLLQQALERSQQRHPNENQCIFQLPAQTNQQSSRISQQSYEEQLQSLRLSPQQVQQLQMIIAGNTNGQMLGQISQLQANSNALPTESQQSNVESIEALILQPSLQLAQNIQFQNQQGNHLFTELSQQANQHLQSQQCLLNESRQQLLQLSQQVPILSLQQSLQQPLLLQILQQSSTASPQQQCPQQNQHPLLQIPQQVVLQSVSVQPSLQQVQQSTQQLLAQSYQRSAQVFQASSNHGTSSILHEIPRGTSQIAQQLQSNQPSILFDESLSQNIQQTLRQMFQQSMVPESRGTNSGSSESASLLAQLVQQQQQQSNQQQIVQQAQAQGARAHLINCGSMGVPLGILQISESQLHPCRQPPEAVPNPIEVPDVSLLDLPPQHLMRIIQQRPYTGQSNRESVMQSFRQLRRKSFMQARKIGFAPLSQLPPHQRAQELLNQQSSAALHQESCLCSHSPENQTQHLSSKTTVSSNSNGASSAWNQRLIAALSIANANQLATTVAAEGHDDDNSVNGEENSNSCLGAEANTSSKNNFLKFIRKF
uniref:Polyhomeotic-like protein 2 n=1 Tax=Elaeophora elaphi TaxID=1147741 RepID=A0A0R3RJY5_9BILA